MTKEYTVYFCAGPQGKSLEATYTCENEVEAMKLFRKDFSFQSVYVDMIKCTKE
jgi:hypothetical protein